MIATALLPSEWEQLQKKKLPRHSGGRDLTRGAEAGFLRYLTKPVKVDELTAALEEILGKR